MTPLRLAIIFDYLEEDWQSMELCAQMLLEHLQSEQAEFLQAVPVRPIFQKRFQRIPWLGKKRVALNGDRLLNRFWDYPRYLSQRVTEFELFHVSDHSYAQLVHVLPPERTGVFCHDLDAFRSLLELEQEPRPAWYRAMSRRILHGLQKASVVFYSTAQVGEQIEHYELLEQNSAVAGLQPTSKKLKSLVQAPYGIAPEFSALPLHTNLVEEPLPKQIGVAPFVLHVGSCIPRKRIDVLLDVFAALRIKHPNLQLVKVGGDWTQNQQEQIARLSIGSSIIHLQGLERITLAALYRRASVVLLTSVAEGFGLPVIEALACGAIVAVSDIPVFREVGGAGVVYCPVADISAWVKTVEQLLENPTTAPEYSLRLAQAQKYSWSNHAQIIANAYLQLLN